MPRPFSPAFTAQPPRGKFARIAAAMFGQQRDCLLCPEDRSLTGKLAVVTGGNRGIGLEITKGLAFRGADVIVAARGGQDTASLCAEIGRASGREIGFVRLDLADKSSIAAAAKKIEQGLSGRRIDVLCANAGISATTWRQNREGFELCYAVNCLGHHRLFSAFLGNGSLRNGARIVFTTGDIYCLAADCTEDYHFHRRGIGAYARSKLGNIWQVAEMSHRYPQFAFFAVHPGVVATELEGGMAGLVGFAKRRLFISPELGAQASLIAASQQLPTGSYLHAKLGLMQLEPHDIARNKALSARFWDNLCKNTW